MHFTDEALLLNLRLASDVHRSQCDFTNQQEIKSKIFYHVHIEYTFMERESVLQISRFSYYGEVGTYYWRHFLLALW